MLIQALLLLGPQGQILAAPPVYDFRTPESAIESYYKAVNVKDVDAFWNCHSPATRQLICESESGGGDCRRAPASFREDWLDSFSKLRRGQSVKFTIRGKRIVEEEVPAVYLVDVMMDPSNVICDQEFHHFVQQTPEGWKLHTAILWEAFGPAIKEVSKAYQDIYPKGLPPEQPPVDEDDDDGGHGGGNHDGGHGADDDDDDRGNNGVGNGQDGQPRGNPPRDDGPGTGPGIPGNKGGSKR